MAYAVWDGSLATSDTSVDNQHQSLFALVNRVHDAILAADTDTIVGEALDQLMLYVVTHFHDEEDLMERSGYPELAAHKTMHAELSTRTWKMAQQYRAGEMMLPLTISRFLHEWLTKHIQEQDKVMVEWIRSHNNTVEGE